MTNTKKMLVRAGKTLGLLAVGYTLHIAVVEAVTYKLYRDFGNCLIDQLLPPQLCEVLVAQNVTAIDKALLYMPNFGKKALDARIQKYIDEHQPK